MSESPATEERARAIAEEAQRARLMRMIVDFTSSVLMQGQLTQADAETLVAQARARVLELFPGKESTYELVLAPRFARLIREFGVPGPRSRKVLPFARR